MLGCPLKFATKNQPLEFLLKTTLDTCLIQPIKQSPSTERTNPMPFSSKETSPIFHYIHGQNTVDGRNPAPVDMVDITLFTGFHTCWVVQFFSINSMTCNLRWFPTLEMLLWKQFLLLHFEVATCWPCWGNTPPPKMDSMYIVTFQVSKQHLSLNIFTSFFVFGEDFQVDQTNIFEDSDMFFSPKNSHTPGIPGSDTRFQ